MSTHSPKTQAHAIQRRKLLLSALAVACLVALDLWSKHAVWSWIEALKNAGELGSDTCTCHHGRVPVVGNWLACMQSLNYGMAWGWGAQVPHLLIGGRIVAVLLIAWLIVRADAAQKGYVFALVLIVSGAIGNLYDNLLRPVDPEPSRAFGPVRDFIDVYFFIPAVDLDWHFATFNVADACITCGALLLILSGFGRGRQEEQPALESGASDSDSDGGSSS